MTRLVAVIGGGITGLAAAHRLLELGTAIEPLLFEAGERLGGVLDTVQDHGFLMEGAADGFVTFPPEAADLCRRLGLDAEQVDAEPRCRKALVLSRGRLVPVPMGFQLMAPSRLWPLLTSPILSLPGKLRAACEFLQPARRDSNDESLQSFCCRRFGSEMYERLVQPLVGGIYAGDPRRLSLAATFPRFPAMEREHGSLTWGMLRSARDHQGAGSAKYGQFRTLRGGMAQLVGALASHLPPESIRLNAPVTQLVPLQQGRWRLTFGPRGDRHQEVDGVILALPAHPCAQIFDHVDEYLANELRGVEYTGCAVVALGFRREQIGHPLDGYGLVVPLVENRLILSCSFASMKYSGRAPDDAALLRVFIGGAFQGGLLEFSRTQLAELAIHEVSDLLQIRGEPIITRVWRHRRALPQYYVGHLERVRRIEARLERFGTLALAGSALYGVGVPRCIASGESAAARIAEQLMQNGEQVLRQDLPVWRRQQAEELAS